MMQVNNSKKINYVVFATQRSGSTLVCDILHNLNLMKDISPNYEVLHRHNLAGNCLAFQKSFVHDLFKQHRLKNISGFKILHSQLEDYATNFLNCNMQDTLELFPKDTYFIWIRRKDLLRQAISMCKAKITQKWKKRNDTKNEHGRYDISNKNIDMEAIRLKRSDYKLEKFFKKGSIIPLTVYYEDFKDDQAVTLRKILQFIGKDIKNMEIKTELLRQSDNETENIINNYKGFLVGNTSLQKFFFIKACIIDIIFRFSQKIRKISPTYGRVVDAIKKLLKIKDNL